MCRGDACDTTECRQDEMCAEGGCLSWRDADLSVDFLASEDGLQPGRTVLQLRPGGFPRAIADGVRFDLGDGISGWGETVRHRYDAPGVYPVEVEVRLADRVLRARRAVVVGDVPADHQPLQLTLNRIPEYLNGRVPFRSDADTPDDPSDDFTEAFHLLVPRHGFTVDIAVLDDPADPIDSASLQLGAGAVDLSSKLLVVDGFASWVVSETDALQPGMTTMTLSGRTASGKAHESALTFEVTELVAERDPFDRPMTWLFRFDMDRFGTTADYRTDGAVVLEALSGPNGKPDFAEELELLGMGDPRFVAIVEREIIERTLRFYDGIDLKIVTTTDGPDPMTFSEDGEFSMMRLGGTLEDVLGRSRFAPHNEARVDDTSDRLGVGTAKLAQLVVGIPGVGDAFDAVRPDRGQPVGTHPEDDAALAAGFDRFDPKNAAATNARYDALQAASVRLAQIIASVTAHEMGHAMGLVPNGPPPAGFFGARGDVSFIGRSHTDSHHADYPPINLMQSGGDFLGVVADALTLVEVPPGASAAALYAIFIDENRLSPYARAYLERRLTYSMF